MKHIFFILVISIFCFTMLSCGKSPSERLYEKAMDKAFDNYDKYYEDAKDDYDRYYEDAKDDYEKEFQKAMDEYNF